ncbi:VOC family protein [Flintibacter muris]|uniref:VOC family protein n=1 Tax=Flintibacter muris TaxID=2941327 RepID=UPI00203AADDB|nr:VOC family protein [Flintibacter muris]
MKYCSSLFAVRSIEEAKTFYQEVLGQKIILDHGTNVTFEGGFALQEGFAGLVGFPEDNVRWKPWNGELYFETEDLDADAARVKESGVELVHDVKEYPWGQRVLRFFDLDGNLIEIGESMRSVGLRYVAQGMSDEEVARRTQHPVELVRLWKSGQ